MRKKKKEKRKATFGAVEGVQSRFEDVKSAFFDLQIGVE